ncbi:MAG: signal peptidase I [Thermotogae bacterium]|nr:signal peptidase I [Thermotogota bacterium]
MKRKTKEKIKKRTKYELIEWGKAFVVAVIAAAIIRTLIFETMLVPTGSMYPTIKPGERLLVEKVTYAFREPKVGDIVVFWTPFVDNMALKQIHLFDKIMYLFSPPRFYSHARYVKRLVGKGGDTIALVPIPGVGYKIYRNGKLEPTLRDKIYYPQGIFLDPEFYEKMAYPDRFKDDINYRAFKLYSKALDFKKCYDKYETNEDYVRVKKDGSISVKIPEGFYFFMGDNSPDSLDSRFWGFVPRSNIIGTPFLRIWPLMRFGIVR